jgi:hypothetical protein
VQIVPPSAAEQFLLKLFCEASVWRSSMQHSPTLARAAVQCILRLFSFCQNACLLVFNDFTVRVSAFLALECASVVIWVIGFNANKPHQSAALWAFWLAEDQSRRVKRLEIRHGCTQKKFSQPYSSLIQSRATGYSN